MPVQETQHAPSLPREVAQETLVSKISVAEGCFETVPPCDHGSEVPVDGVPVAEDRFEGGLPRGDATETPVGRGAVAEEDK